MSARWTVRLWQTSKGWNWQRWNPELGRPIGSSWGLYATSGAAQGAAKRSISPVYGGKTNPKDFDFVITEGETS